MSDSPLKIKPGHPVWMLVAGAALLAVLVLAALGRENACEFVLINRSGEIIAQATVEACGQKRETGDLMPAEQYRSAFRIQGDSHYGVKVKFASGRVLNKELGYLTGGFDYHDFLTVTNSDIILSGTHQ